jgi:N-acetylated-alpha-linked acidic dipeptidase
MRQFIVVIGLSVACAGVVLVSAQNAAPSPNALRGFSTAGAHAQRARERAFMAMPSAKEAEADFDIMTAAPHHTGSPYQITLADYVAEQFSGAGFEAAKYEYSVLLPWPGDRRIEIVAPDRVTLDVDEETLADDRWASMPGILPAYNAYSPAGDVTGEIVYVNYGIPADYEVLSNAGVDVRGKIVLARYGGSWRGIRRRSPPSMVPSAASSTRIRTRTATFKATLIRPVPSAPPG